MTTTNENKPFGINNATFLELGSRTITETDIVNFAGISGDFYPLHTSEEFAKNTVFGRRVAHGLLTLSATSGLWTSSKLFKNSIIAFYGISRIQFMKPVFPGDTIRVRIKFLTKEKRKNGELLTFTSETIVGDSKVMILEAKFLMESGFSIPH